MRLPQYQVFGDYQLFYDLKSNVNFITHKNRNVRFMCVSKKVFLNLCDLFPITAENLRIVSLKRRKFYIQAMEQLDQQSGALKALQRSIRRKMKMAAPTITETKLSSTMTTPQGTSRGVVTGNLEMDGSEGEEELEQFFSDEEPKISVEDEETPEVVMKKISKKQSKYIVSIHECTKAMDTNFELIKKHLKEGRSSNPSASSLKGSVIKLSDKFQQKTGCKTKTLLSSLSMPLSQRLSQGPSEANSFRQSTMNNNFSKFEKFNTVLLQARPKSNRRDDSNDNNSKTQTIPKINLFAS